MVKEKKNSMTELYMHVLPALRSKRTELRRKKLGFITEMDIWEYLRNCKWYQERDLTLFDIVSDIFNIEDHVLIEYMNKDFYEEE